MDRIELSIGGKVFEVPRVNLKTLRELTAQGHIANLAADKVGSPEWLDAICAIVAAAVHRRYPDVTPDWVAENSDVGDMAALATVVTAVLGGKSSDLPNAVSP